jgi:hypothetical protein
METLGVYLGIELGLYRLPDGHAEVLVDADSPWYVAPLALTLAGAARALPS